MAILLTEKIAELPKDRTFLFLEKASQCPTATVNVRGTDKLEIPEDPTWLHFSQSTDGLYSMYHSWKLDPEWVDDLCASYQMRLGIRFTRAHFILLCSVGSTPIHKDYGPEVCRINIGLKDSMRAKTQFFEYVNKEWKDSVAIQMQDGLTMVFDPRSTHQVQSGSRQPRYIGSLACFCTEAEVVRRFRERPSDLLPNVPSKKVFADGKLSIDHEFPNERVK